MREYVEHHHTERPHQKANARLIAASAPMLPPRRGDMRERLGGVMRHYYRKVA